MALLSRPLQLHDALDIEALMWKVIDGSGPAAGLRQHERQDLCAYLIGVAWECSLTYNPKRGSSSFSTFVFITAQRRIIDFVRRERGRTKWTWADGRKYERERPQLVSLDGPEHHRLGDALAAGDGDLEVGSDSDFGGLLGARDRTRAADYEELGLRPPRRAA